MQDVNFIYDTLRKLAKSNHYQTLYSCAKELNIRLFDNDTDLSDVQMMFITYLNIYEHLAMDLTMGDVTNIVLECFIYEDAYLYYKTNKTKKNTNLKGKNKEETVVGSKWTFKTKQ